MAKRPSEILSLHEAGQLQAQIHDRQLKKIERNLVLAQESRLRERQRWLASELERLEAEIAAL